MKYNSPLRQPDISASSVVLAPIELSQVIRHFLFMSFTLDSKARLNNGVEIPRLGLGVYQTPP